MKNFFKNGLVRIIASTSIEYVHNEAEIYKNIIMFGEPFKKTLLFYILTIRLNILCFKLAFLRGLLK